MPGISYTKQRQKNVWQAILPVQERRRLEPAEVLIKEIIALGVEKNLLTVQ
jgi:hypothetical protein